MPRIQLVHVPYTSLCREAAIDELWTATDDAIARVAPAGEEQPATPVDLAGVVGPDTPASDRVDSRLPESWWGTPFPTPEVYAACLQDAVVFGGRKRSWHLLLTADGRLVDDSYLVRNRTRALPVDRVEEAEGVPTVEVDLDALPRLPGTHYLVGTANGHFGHFLVEGLARMWLADQAPADARFVVRDTRLAAWHYELLAAAGAPRERIVIVDEPTRFERLIVPSATYNLHRAAAPHNDRMWQRIAQWSGTPGDQARIYLSRSHIDDRRGLREEALVEDLFRARGFTIVHPQERPIREQVALARGARLVAGVTGSAMYLTAFQQAGGHKLLIGPRNFTFRDDQMISHFRDGSLHYFLVDERPGGTGKQIPKPPKEDFSMDVAPLGPAIDAWLQATAAAPPSVALP